MDIHWLFRIIFLLILLLISAFFSSSEVALFSLDKRKFKNNSGINPLIGRYLLTLIDNSRRLHVSILIGNTVVNVAACIIAVSLVLDILKVNSMTKEFMFTLQIIVLTVLIIIFGELIPKMLAAKNPLTIAKLVSIPLHWFSIIIYPISEAINEIMSYIVSKEKFDNGKAAVSPEKINELAEFGHKFKSLAEEEQGIIQSIVSFKSVAVQEVMTPRVDMIAVAADISLFHLIEAIKSTQHSRIPIYKKNLDGIIGIIYAKDILKYLLNKNLNGFDIYKLTRKAMFIPKNKMINDLMYEFQEKKMHIAIVVDEYGGTAGLVTLEDIIEEIVGEIRDEYDKEENPVVKINGNKYMVSGRISLDELNELFDTNISTENGNFETLGGLILNFAGHIPKEGYNFNLENFKFTIKEITRKRINKVLIEKIQSE